jgi:hypothetical protein
MNAVDFGLADRISSGSVGDRKSVELVRQNTLPFTTLPAKPRWSSYMGLGWQAFHQSPAPKPMWLAPRPNIGR